MWHNMTTYEKQPYFDLNLNDKKRFAEQNAELQTKGFYTLEDGSKSYERAELFYKTKKTQNKASIKNR